MIKVPKSLVIGLMLQTAICQAKSIETPEEITVNLARKKAASPKKLNLKDNTIALEISIPRQVVSLLKLDW